MSRPAVGVAATAALVLLTVLGPAAAGTAAAAGPSVEATVGGTPLGGERVVVAADPSLRIDATAEDPIETVAVRVDGDLVRSFSPNATAADRTVPLALRRGEHRVEVVVDAGDRTTSLVGTVAKDTTAPRVAYTSPATSPTPVASRAFGSRTPTRTPTPGSGTDTAGRTRSAIRGRRSRGGSSSAWGRTTSAFGSGTAWATGGRGGSPCCSTTAPPRRSGSTGSSASTAGPGSGSSAPSATT